MKPFNKHELNATINNAKLTQFFLHNMLYIFIISIHIIKRFFFLRRPFSLVKHKKQNFFGSPLGFAFSVFVESDIGNDRVQFQATG